MNLALQKEDSFSYTQLLTLLQKREARIAVIGMGYVGFPLTLALHRQGFPVTGFDTDSKKIISIHKGKSYIKTIPDEMVQKLIEDPLFEITANPQALSETDVILICVPTPLTRNREPDMSYVTQTLHTLSKHLRVGQLIVLESTTYPGTTRELIVPILEEKGFQVGEDIFVAYSPEREDPGNPHYETSMIPKVLGADDLRSRELATYFYNQFVPKVAVVSSSTTAEAVKLTENIFRSVNIALVNELKMVFDRMGIDIWEVIEAAKTKPFGYMPFYPGPGLGGHCIPIDPFYLTWKAREFGISTRFIELSGEINALMPSYVIERLREELDQRFCRGLNGTRILLLGIAYKKNIDDMRESPALVIFEQLLSRGAIVAYYDPLIPHIGASREHPALSGISSIDFSPEILENYDAVVICTDHDRVDYQSVVSHSRLVLDTRNATENVKEKKNVAKA